VLGDIKNGIDEMIVNAVERMRVSAEKIPVLAVGGGSILIPDKVGDLPVIRPEHFDVANAVGAAIGQISGEVDRIFSDSIELLDQEDVPLAYLPGNATRIRLKVVGDLNG